MKKCCTLLTLILYSTFLSGQSAFSIELGSVYAQVKSAISQQNFTHINDQEKDQLTVKADNYQVTYYFNDDVLYKSEMTIAYKSHKTANVTTTAMRNYYDMAQAEVMDLKKDKQHVRFAALRDRELHEVVQVELDRKTVQVRQTKMDLDRCPGSDLMELHDDQVLFSMLYR